MSEEFLKASKERIPLPIEPESVLLNLAGSLGLSESEEMQTIRKSLSRSEDKEGLLRKLTSYQTIGEQEVDKVEDNLKPKAQIGLILASASIYYRVRLIDSFRENVEDAILYADNMGYEEIVTPLQKLLKETKEVQ